MLRPSDLAVFTGKKKMNNKITFTISIILLCSVLLACSFRFGDTNSNSPNDVSRDKSASENNNSEEKKTSSEKKRGEKIESFQCEINKMAYYLVPAGLSRKELIETARDVHNAEEQETKLWFVDDDALVKQHISYFKQWCAGSADESLFPKDWAERHVVAATFPAGDGTWDLYEGNGAKKIANLKDEKTSK